MTAQPILMKMIWLRKGWGKQQSMSDRLRRQVAQGEKING